MMNSNDDLLISADSGGSKTDWRLLTADGTTIASCTTGGVASLHENMLPVLEYIRQAAAELGNPDVKAVCFSLGGPNTGEVERALKTVWPQIPVIVEREASGELLAACRQFLGCDGAVLGGTGVTAIGFGADGKCRYAEGWGPVFGDLGSGGGIGLLAVQNFLRQVDGTAPSGRLKELFAEFCAGLDISVFSGRMELKRRINELNRQQLAALAPQVMQLAMENDPAANKIIAASAENMAQLAAAVAPEKGRIMMLGGLFKLGEAYRQACQKALTAIRQDCSFFYDERISMGKLVSLRVIQLSGNKITSQTWEKIIK